MDTPTPILQNLYDELGQVLMVTHIPPEPSTLYHTPGKLLNVPYVSQHGAGAQKYRKDCGPACVKMCGDYLQKYPVSVDDIMADITGGVDRSTYISELVAAANKWYDVVLARRNSMDYADLVLQLDCGNPIICLVKYKYDEIRMDRAYAGGHFIVVVGYDYIRHEGETVMRIIVHDPDYYGKNTVSQGAFLPIVLPHFMQMWDRCHEDGNPDRMGLVASY